MSDMTISKGGDNLAAVTDEFPSEPLFYESKPKEGKSRLIKTVSLTDRVLQSLLSYVGYDDGTQKAIDSWYKEHAERCRLMAERAKLEFLSVSFLGTWADNKVELTPYSSSYLPPEYAKIYEPAYLRPLCNWCSTMSNGLKNPDIKVTKMKFKNIPLRICNLKENYYDITRQS